jgi:hypothetical protein
LPQEEVTVHREVDMMEKERDFESWQSWMPTESFGLQRRNVWQHWQAVCVSYNHGNQIFVYLSIFE